MEMEEGYRRGTVLGLTIAEIFILLVFLMLLALLGMNRYWDDKLDPWRVIIEENTPAEVELALMQPDELRRGIERLNNQIEELKKEKDRLQGRIRTLVAREGTVGEKLDETKRLLEECEKALEDAKRGIETLMIENLRLREEKRCSRKPNSDHRQGHYASVLVPGSRGDESDHQGQLAGEGVLPVRYCHP